MDGDQELDLPAEEECVQPTLEIAHLTLIKTDVPNPVFVGQDLTYTLTLFNDGPADAEGVAITDPLPAGALFVSASPACSESGGVVTCPIGNLPSGASRTMEIAIRPLLAGEVVNVAAAQGTNTTTAFGETLTTAIQPAPPPPPPPPTCRTSCCDRITRQGGRFICEQGLPSTQIVRRLR